VDFTTAIINLIAAVLLLLTALLPFLQSKKNPLCIILHKLAAFLKKSLVRIKISIQVGELVSVLKKILFVNLVYNFLSENWPFYFKKISFVAHLATAILKKSCSVTGHLQKNQDYLTLCWVNS
jgi:hypothetical protein